MKSSYVEFKNPSLHLAIALHDVIAMHIARVCGQPSEAIAAGSDMICRF
jgi:hypothetical protein